MSKKQNIEVQIQYIPHWEINPLARHWGGIAVGYYFRWTGASAGSVQSKNFTRIAFKENL